MLFFVPAWYYNNEWCEYEQVWSARKTKSEFDDTVKQIQLFHRNEMCSYKVLILSYAPNLRHFFHRLSIYHAPYWSCFDAIQQISKKKASVFSFHDLNWPKDIEFIYTPFEVLAMQNNKKYAKIEFGEDGNTIRIDMFQNGIICRRNIYDDRGFVGASIVFENGVMKYQDYLNEKGAWKLRYYYSDGHVEINDNMPYYTISVGDENKEFEFSRKVYSNMEMVIEEVLGKYLSYTAGDDMFCVAMHKQHIHLMERLLVGRNLILSFFKDRYSMDQLDGVEKIVGMSDYVVTDSSESRALITNRLRKCIRYITDISPFDTRTDVGISQQLKVQKLLVPIDELDDRRFEQIILVLSKYLKKNKRARIHLFTRNSDTTLTAKLMEKVRNLLASNGFDEYWAVPEAEREDRITGIGNLKADIQKKTEVRFEVDQCVSELDVSKCIREQRVLIDLRDVPDQYLQISAISGCIPQIVINKSRFIDDNKNGRVISNIDQLFDAVDYYVSGLANWNEAAVNSYELGKKFSTKVLVNKWKGVIRSIG